MPTGAQRSGTVPSGELGKDRPPPSVSQATGEYTAKAKSDYLRRPVAPGSADRKVTRLNSLVILRPRAVFFRHPMLLVSEPSTARLRAACRRLW